MSGGNDTVQGDDGWTRVKGAGGCRCLSGLLLREHDGRAGGESGDENGQDDARTGELEHDGSSAGSIAPSRQLIAVPEVRILARALSPMTTCSAGCNARPAASTP